MVTLETLYYIIAIIGILCGGAFKLGYELGKHDKNAKK